MCVEHCRAPGIIPGLGIYGDKSRHGLAHMELADPEGWYGPCGGQILHSGVHSLGGNKQGPFFTKNFLKWRIYIIPLICDPE